MALTESTPVTVHQHTGGTSTFAHVTYGLTLSPDQATDAILGTAVLSNGAEVVVTATVGLVAYAGAPPPYSLVPSYTSVQVATIDNGVVTPNTLSFGSSSDATGSIPASDFLDRDSFLSESLQVVALSGGGYVIAETTVNDNIGPV